jgi:hypothetical protein
MCTNNRRLEALTEAVTSSETARDQKLADSYPCLAMHLDRTASSCSAVQVPVSRLAACWTWTEERIGDHSK